MKLMQRQSDAAFARGEGYAIIDAYVALIHFK